MSKNKIAWRKEREEEISCDYQNRIEARSSEVHQKIEAAKKNSAERLRQQINSIQAKHEAALNRMHENYELQIQKLRGKR